MLSIFGYSYKRVEGRDLFCFLVDGVIEENRYVGAIFTLCGGYLSHIVFVSDKTNRTYIYINKINKGFDPDNGRYLRLLGEICK